MFVRKKRNKSGSVSVQVIDKSNGYHVVKTIGGGGRGRGMGGRGATGMRRGAGATTAAPEQPANTTIAHQYKIEASKDGINYTTVLDKTKNNVTKFVEFDEIPPTKCRFVRLTMTDWPRNENSNLGIMEFTVFGKPVLQ